MGILSALKESLSFAADHLSGAVRRMFMAKTVDALGPGGQRRAQEQLGWTRDTIRDGAADVRSGQPRVDHRRFNGPKASIELRLPGLRQDIRDIVQPHLQADPKLNSTRLYCRLSVAQIAKALVKAKGYRPAKPPSRSRKARSDEGELPCNDALRKIINAMGYVLRKVRKCKPLKKVPEADQIFETVRDLNRLADASENDEILRISIDAKARVHVGEFSRGGYCRVERRALDHDFDPKYILVPVGLFLPKYNESYMDLYFDRAPADAWVDSLDALWQRECHRFPHTKQLLLNLDNGPENNSYRTQFMARLVEFANKTGLILTLAYYPPYQSKYNAVERYWGVVENTWSGELLDTIEAVVGFASSVTYNGVQTVVRLIDKVYDKGVSVTKEVMRQVNAQLMRAAQIPKYLVTIVAATCSP